MVAVDPQTVLVATAVIEARNYLGLEVEQGWWRNSVSSVSCCRCSHGKATESEQRGENGEGMHFCYENLGWRMLDVRNQCGCCD